MQASNQEKLRQQIFDPLNNSCLDKNSEIVIFEAIQSLASTKTNDELKVHDGLDLFRGRKDIGIMELGFGNLLGEVLASKPGKNSAFLIFDLENRVYLKLICKASINRNIILVGDVKNLFSNLTYENVEVH